MESGIVCRGGDQRAVAAMKIGDDGAGVGEWDGECLGPVVGGEVLLGAFVGCVR